MEKVTSYKDIEEGEAVGVVQDFFIQLLLNAAVHLSHKVVVSTNTHHFYTRDQQKNKDVKAKRCGTRQHEAMSDKQTQKKLYNNWQQLNRANSTRQTQNGTHPVQLGPFKPKDSEV